jgi:glyoxalase family protein
MAIRTISGIHHITAIAGDPQRNLDFYTSVLGLRLVKLTVNFDDPGTYHFYFGNQGGGPGSILTFFPWPTAPRGSVGNGQVAASAFAVSPASIDYWMSRLAEHHASPEQADPRFGDPVVRFVDPDGLPLEIIGTVAADSTKAWSGGPVPVEHAACGFHSATLAEEGYEKTAALLEVMGFQLVGNEGSRYRYKASGEPASIIDVLCAPDGRQGRMGVGTVHHIAFRTPDDEQQGQWREDLVQRGFNVSPIMDRIYFHSIYLREPGGVLFEIATDPPGFALDESPDQLGTRLMLPPWLETHRSQLEPRLPRLTRNDL